MAPSPLADELETKGSLLDAVDALTEANRVRRDPDVERRLVRLRHEAFAEIDRSAEPAASPPVAQVEYAGARVPSVASPSELTAEMLRSAILQHGSLHVRGVVPTARVDDLVAGIDRALHAVESFASGVSREETTPWFEPFSTHASYPKAMNRQLGNRRKWVHESGGVWAADSPRMLFELFTTLDDVGLTEVITTYLGERPALAIDKCTLRRVGLDTSTDWHQDGAFLGSGIRTVNMWLSLSHCGRDAPGLDIVPTRLDRIVETGTAGAKFQWSVGQGVVDSVSTESPVIRPIFEPGDVLFFDDLFLHRTAIDSAMSRERYAIESWFFAPSAYPEKYAPLMV
jgi:Phytanoyl-CoA dioxygenase (PhyH)